MGGTKQLSLMNSSALDDFQLIMKMHIIHHIRKSLKLAILY